MPKEKYGFVYIWRDRKHKRYYVGCHWGSVDDGYICSSNWMRDSYKRRPEDFKRRIIKTNITPRPEMYVEEQRYLNMIKDEEIKIRYYNLCLKPKDLWHKYDENIKTIGQKISASKTGKSTGPCSEEKRKSISEGKKKAFQNYTFTDDHKRQMAENRRGKPQSEEWKAAHSKRLKEQWANGTRGRS